VAWRQPPRKPAGRTPAARATPAPKRQGIAMHNPAFAAEAASTNPISPDSEDTMFRNLKVSTRLALGFGVVSLLLAAVVLLGIRSLANVKDNVDDMVGDKYPKVVLAYDLIGDIHSVAIAMRNIVVSSSADTTRRELARIEELAQGSGRRHGPAETAHSLRTRQAAVRRHRRERQKYLGGQEQFIRLAGEGKTRRGARAAGEPGRRAAGGLHQGDRKADRLPALG
jgi:hypothetical protein